MEKFSFYSPFLNHQENNLIENILNSCFKIEKNEGVEEGEEVNEEVTEIKEKYKRKVMGEISKIRKKYVMILEKKLEEIIKEHPSTDKYSPGDTLYTLFYASLESGSNYIKLILFNPVAIFEGENVKEALNKAFETEKNYFEKEMKELWKDIKKDYRSDVEKVRKNVEKEMNEEIKRKTGKDASEEIKLSKKDIKVRMYVKHEIEKFKLISLSSFLEHLKNNDLIQVNVPVEALKQSVRKLKLAYNRELFEKDASYRRIVMLTLEKFLKDYFNIEFSMKIY